MNVDRLKFTVVAAAVATVLSAGYSYGNLPFLTEAVAASQSAQPAITQTTAPVAALPDMSSIVAKNGPAVVNISVSATQKVSARTPETEQLDPNDPMYQFFRHFGLPQQQNNAPMRGQGSGFIVRADGTILTNAHVVEGADEVTVKLTDKREFRAKVLGMDKASDVAVLKIDATNLPVVTNGSASSARVGDWVLAIGSPFGFENSATAGIVSAKGRSLPDGGYVPFIQTDVAVNPGNSGGPLFNTKGEVIGINSQIYSRNGGYQGLSFAIPIEVAMKVEQQIVAHGKVQHGRLGVSIQEVNQSLADSFGLKTTAGALVGSVEKGGPAAKGGLESGDIILGVNGTEIGSANELPAIIANMAPGETAKLKIWRKGSARDVDVQVGTLKGERLASTDRSQTDKGRFGVAVRDLTPEEKAQADIKSGVVVENVSGAAAKAGIEPGDIVLSINGEPVTKTEQLRALIAKAGKRIAVLIERGDARIFVPVELG